MMFLQVPWVASHTESCDLSCKVGYPSRRNIPAYSSPSEVSPITLPDEFLGCDRSSIWAASWNLGQDCAVGTTKKQKSQALVWKITVHFVRCLLYLPMGGFTKSSRQLLWAKMLNQSHLPWTIGQIGGIWVWNQQNSRDVLTPLWAEPKHDVWECAALDMDCNYIRLSIVGLYDSLCRKMNQVCSPPITWNILKPHRGRVWVAEPLCRGEAGG